jgi:RNA polymerase sigma-70 factor (ECF subfamily)
MSVGLDQQERFVGSLIACQPRLYAYILSAVTDVNEAEDVLQETNVVLWRKAEEAGAADNFVAWACKVAYFQVLAHLQRRKRDRQVFDVELLQQLADESARQEISNSRVALKGCIDKLPVPQRTLLMDRYAAGASVQDIAQRMGRPVGSISQTLYRVRAALRDCILRALGKEAL